jgi:hypothetical protein
MNVKTLVLIATFAQALSVWAQGTPPQVSAGSTAGTQTRQERHPADGGDA